MSDGHYDAVKKLFSKKDNRTIVVNIFGGPGSGKSIICSDIFSKLKWNHVKTEMALEYVKDEVWENNINAISNQLFILGNQHQRINRLLDKVDVIITDSPILNSVIYDMEKNIHFKNYVIEKFNQNRNLNVFIDRNPDEFEKIGRLHNLSKSIEIDNKILKILNENKIDYIKLKMEKCSIDKLYYEIKKLL